MAERLGSRTQERVAPLPVFKTGAFNRSAISPFARFYKYNYKIQLKTDIFFIYFVVRQCFIRATL